MINLITTSSSQNARMSFELWKNLRCDNVIHVLKAHQRLCYRFYSTWFWDLCSRFLRDIDFSMLDVRVGVILLSPHPIDQVQDFHPFANSIQRFHPKLIQSLQNVWKIGLLDKTQSKMLNRVSHKTMWAVTICVMHVGYQTSASSCPFCDCSCNFVDRPKCVRSTNSCQNKHVMTIWEHTFDNSPTASSSSSVKLRSSKQGNETLYHSSVLLFAKSQHLSTHFFERPSIS